MADRPATTSPQKPGRKRRVAGWTLLVIGMLITGVWGISERLGFGYDASAGTVEAQRGLLVLVVNSQDRVWPRGLYRFVLDGQFPQWRWRITRPPYGWNGKVYLGVVGHVPDSPLAPFSSGSHEVRVLMWPFGFAPLLAGGFLLWWSGRRARVFAARGWCAVCGYDLRGLAAEGVCPECGARAQAAR